MSRITLKQKDWDKLKRAVEKFIESVGGSFEDAQRTGGRVWSIYQYQSSRWSTMWHGSYSANSARRNKITDIKKGFRELGLEVSKQAFALRDDYLEWVKEHFQGDIDEATYFAQWNALHRDLLRGKERGSEAVREFIKEEIEFLAGTKKTDGSHLYWDVIEASEEE